jgi:hypothetical protein
LKSKKLFAILTLVAFMMTLVPAMAFGAFGVPYTATGSQVVDVDKETLKAEATATISVEFYDGKELLVATPIDDFYVKRSKDGVKVTAVQTSGERELTFDPVTGIATATGLETNDDGIIEFKVTSDFAEEFNISFWSTEAAAKDELSIGFIGEAVITFTSSASKVETVSLTVTYGDAEKKAGDEVKLVARVEDKNKNAVKGKTVTFYKKKGDSGSFTTLGTATTNNLGKAEFKYDETEAGDYTYEAKCGSTKSDQKKLTIDASDPLKIEAVTADGKIFDVDKDDNEIKFVVTDYYGNKITNASKVLVSVTSAPKDSDLEDEDINDVTINDDDEIVAKIPFDEVGDYTIKAKLKDSGIFTTVKVKAMEAGEAEEIIVKFKKDHKKSLIAGKIEDDKPDSLELDVKLVDANGIEFDADDYKAYSSDVSLIKTNINAGVLTLTGPTDEDKRGVVTITVVDLESGETASIEVPVVGQPYAIDADYTVSGKTAAVTLQLVDDEGAVTATRAAKEDYELILPEGVTVVDKKLFNEDSGEASFKAIVDEYGTYELTVVTESGIAKQFEIVVGEPAEEKTR